MSLDRGVTVFSRIHLFVLRVLIHYLVQFSSPEAIHLIRDLPYLQ